MSVKKNTFYNIIKTFSSIVFPLITFPYSSRVLHAENIGKVNFGNSIVGYISLLASFGISTYAVRECSRLRDDKKQLEETASELISINLITTLFAYVVLALLLIFWKNLKGYGLLILIQSSAVLFATIGADWINTAMEDFKYITVRTLVFQLLSLAAMFTFVRKPDDYMIYAAIAVLSSSGANIVNLFYRQRFCKTKLTFHIDWKKHVKPILLLFTMLLSQVIFTNVDITMLGLIKGDKAVGLYSTAVKIYNMVNQVIASIAIVVLPQLSYWYDKKNYIEINKLLKYAAQYITTLGIPCLVGLFVLAPEIIEVVAGKEYFASATVLRILTVALLFSFMGGFVGNIIFISSKREKICLLSCTVAAVANLFANSYFIPKFGINGAAITTVFAEFISFIIGVKFIEKEVSLGSAKDLFLSPLLGSCVIVLIVYICKRLFSNVLIITIASIVLSSLCYFAVIYKLKNPLSISICKSIKNKLGVKKDE